MAKKKKTALLEWCARNRIDRTAVGMAVDPAVVATDYASLEVRALSQLAEIDMASYQALHEQQVPEHAPAAPEPTRRASPSTVAGIMAGRGARHSVITQQLMRQFRLPEQEADEIASRYVPTNRSRPVPEEEFRSTMMDILDDLRNCPYELNETARHRITGDEDVILTVEFQCLRAQNCTYSFVSPPFSQFIRLSAEERRQAHHEWLSDSLRSARIRFRDENIPVIINNACRAMNGLGRRRGIDRQLCFYNADQPLESRMPFTTAMLGIIRQELRAFLRRPEARVFRHTADVVMAQLGHYGRDAWFKERPAPKELIRYGWMGLMGLPTEVVLEEFTARLIDDNHKLYEETKKMEHCIYNAAFYDLIREGKYIAYHIDGPLTKTGFTLGLEPKGTEWKVQQLKSRRNQMHHNSNLRLKAVVEEVVRAVNRATQEAIRDRLMYDRKTGERLS